MVDINSLLGALSQSPSNGIQGLMGLVTRPAPQDTDQLDLEQKAQLGLQPNGEPSEVRQIVLAHFMKRNPNDPANMIRPRQQQQGFGLGGGRTRVGSGGSFGPRLRY